MRLVSIPAVWPRRTFLPPPSAPSCRPRTARKVGGDCFAFCKGVLVWLGRISPAAAFSTQLSPTDSWEGGWEKGGWDYACVSCMRPCVVAGRRAGACLFACTSVFACLRAHACLCACCGGGGQDLMVLACCAPRSPQLRPTLLPLSMLRVQSAPRRATPRWLPPQRCSCSRHGGPPWR